MWRILPKVGRLSVPLVMAAGVLTSPVLFTISTAQAQAAPSGPVATQSIRLADRDDWRCDRDDWYRRGHDCNYWWRWHHRDCDDYWRYCSPDEPHWWWYNNGPGRFGMPPFVSGSL